jgi:ligand-binding sensor domain-containing protein
MLKFTSGIRSVFEDSKGNVWFGSQDEGAAMYDGEGIIYFSKNDDNGAVNLAGMINKGKRGLSNNQVRDIQEDENGLIWLTGGEGLSTWNGNQMSIRTERVYDRKDAWQLGEKDLWFKSDEINGYSEKEGKPGIYRYDGDNLVFHALPVIPGANERNYYSITTPFLRGNEGMLWVGAYGAVIRYNGQGFTILDNSSLGLTEETGFLHVRSILEDSKGNLWIGNNGIGVLHYKDGKVVNFTEEYDLKKENTNGNHLEKVFSIGEDTVGNIWFGTSGSGVWRWDGESLTNFTEKDGLESKHIWIIYTTKNGELWFGGAGPSGVYAFKDGAFEKQF